MTLSDSRSIPPGCILSFYMTEITPRLSAALADRYSIERELGADGMATAYLAEDLKHRRKVALKVLRRDLAQGSSVATPARACSPGGYWDWALYVRARVYASGVFDRHRPPVTVSSPSGGMKSPSLSD